MKMKMAKRLIATIMMICLLLTGCDSGSTGNAELDKFVSYMKDTYNKDVNTDNVTDNNYTSVILNDDGSVSLTFTFRYFDSQDDAMSYYEFMKGIYESEDLEAYDAGTEGIIMKSYADDADGNDIEDDSKAYYNITVIDGVNIYSAESVKGKKSELEAFIKAMT